jgi:hypothetical protein
MDLCSATSGIRLKVRLCVSDEVPAMIISMDIPQTDLQDRGLNRGEEPSKMRTVPDKPRPK